MFSRAPGLHPLDSSGNPCLVGTTETSPDLATVPCLAKPCLRALGGCTQMPGAVLPPASRPDLSATRMLHGHLPVHLPLRNRNKARESLSRS